MTFEGCVDWHKVATKYPNAYKYYKEKPHSGLSKDLFAFFDREMIIINITSGYSDEAKYDFFVEVIHNGTRLQDKYAGMIHKRPEVEARAYLMAFSILEKRFYND